MCVLSTHSPVTFPTVLYGSEGYLEVTSSGNYPSNVVCSWTVTLPEGSRPVFRWYYLDIEKCSPCSKCDIVFVRDINHRRYVLT